MPYSNPITQNELQDLALHNPLHPRDGSPAEQYMPQAYFLVPPATQAGPVKWRLFDAAYITTGIIDPNRLGTGATGAGNLYLADDGTWKSVGGGGGGGDMYKATYDVDNDGTVDSAERIEIIVRNSTGTTLTKGTVVYLSGATGNRPNAVRAQANSEATSSKTFGIVVADINDNSDGYVACNGTLHDLDTSAFADGAALWLSATTAGAYTSTIPAEPNHTVFIGYVARSHPTQGRLVILIQNGYELNELHGVLISSEANNDLLTYESSTGLWKNKTISTIFGGTPLVSVPTLAQVTTAGNTTTNAITVGNFTSQDPSGVYSRFAATTNTSYPRGYFYIGSSLGDSVNNVGLSVNPDVSSGVQKTTFLEVRTNPVNSASTRRFAFEQRSDLTFLYGSSDNGNSAGTPMFITTQGGSASTPAIYIGNTASQNVIIGSSTDAGYKLDVNGTGRINDTLTITKPFQTGVRERLLTASVSDASGDFFFVNNGTIIDGSFAPVFGGIMTSASANNLWGLGFSGFTTSALDTTPGNYGIVDFAAMQTTNASDPLNGTLSNVTTRKLFTFRGLNQTSTHLTIFASGNVNIGNVLTDTGYKLDVNGTARVSGNLTVDTNTLFVDAANNRVGIGTITPSAKVDINLGAGDITNSVYIRNSSSTGYSSVTMFDDRNTTSYIGQWGIYGSGVASPNTSNMFFYNTAGGGIGFYVGTGAVPTNDLRLLIKSSGNVLIGTNTDAGYKLDVNGTARIQSNLLVNGPSTFTDRIYLGDYGADTDTNYYIQSGGQVYIQANAFRANNYYTDLVLMSGTTSVSQIQIRGNDDSSGFIRFTVNNAEAARFFNNGDLAIGTTSDDGYKLNVNGVIAATGGTSTNWNTAYSWGNHATAGYLTSQPWVTSGSNIYYSTGNVGIGTTNPSYKLQVNGSFNATNPMINSASTADNVSAMEWRYGTIDSYRLILKQTVTSGVVRWNFSQINNSTAYNNVLVLDRGAVGIGTTNPTLGLLHVEGTVYSTRYELAQGTDLASGVAGIRVLDNFGGMYQYNNSGPYTGHFTYYHIRDTSATTMFYATSSAFGIGTLTPSHRLEVVGSSFIQAQIRSTDNAAGIKLVPSSGNNYEIQATNGNEFLIYDRSVNAYRFLINGSGNVIIGNSITPLARFHIIGSGTTSATTALRVENSSNTTSLVVLDDGNIGIGTTTPAYKLTISSGAISMFAIDNGAHFIAKNSAGSYENYLWPRWTDNIMYLNYGSGGFNIRNNSYTSTMFLTNGGNVGIGTTSPTARVHVIGGAQVWNETTPGTTPGTIHMDAGFYEENRGNAITFGYSGSTGEAHAGIYVRTGGGYGTKMYFATTDLFASGSKTRLYIAPNGYIGVNTTSPQSRFDIYAINDGLRVRSSGEGINSSLYLGTGWDANAKPKTAVIAKALGNWSRADLYFCLNGTLDNSVEVTTADAKMVILNGGNVGIGMTNPAYKLDVNGSIRGRDNIYITSFDVNDGIFADDAFGSTMFSISRRSADEIRFQSYAFITFFTSGNTGTEKIRITEAGNIGIGTTSPTSLLTLAKDNNIGINTVDGSDNGYLALSGAGGDGDSRGGHIYLSGNERSADAGTAVIAAGNVGSIQFRTGTSVERMRITSTGNVGIGTTSPSQQLHVTGKVLIGALDNYGDANTKLYIHSPTNAVNIVLHPRPTAGDIYYRVKLGVDVSSTSSFYVEHEGIGRIIEAWNSGGYLNLSSVVSLGDKKWTLETNGYGLQMYSPYGWSSVVRYTNAATGTTATDGALTGITENGDFRVWTYESHPMLFATANVERLRITSTGDVGIGTITPTDKLSVVGTVAATGYKINGNAGWSGTISIPSNPPGQQNITVEGGLITNFGA